MTAELHHPEQDTNSYLQHRNTGWKGETMCRYGGNTSSNSPACYSCSGVSRLPVATLSHLQTLWDHSLLWYSQKRFPVDWCRNGWHFLGWCQYSPRSSQAKGDRISTYVYTIYSLIGGSLDILLMSGLHFSTVALGNLLGNTMAHFPGFLLLWRSGRDGQELVSPVLSSWHTVRPWVRQLQVWELGILSHGFW